MTLVIHFVKLLVFFLFVRQRSCLDKKGRNTRMEQMFKMKKKYRWRTLFGRRKQITVMKMDTRYNWKLITCQGALLSWTSCFPYFHHSHWSDKLRKKRKGFHFWVQICICWFYLFSACCPAYKLHLLLLEDKWCTDTFVLFMWQSGSRWRWKQERRNWWWWWS